MERWINFQHLNEAKVNYIPHLIWGIYEALFLLMLALFSVIHAIFPFIFNFKLLEIRVRKAMKFYDFLPEHPVWQEVKDKLKNESK